MAALRVTLARRLSQIAKVGSSAGAANPLPGARNEPRPIRCFLSSCPQKQPFFQLPLPPDRLSLPVGDPLVRRIRGLNQDRIRLDLHLPPSGSIPAGADEVAGGEKGMLVGDVRKAVRASQMDAARARLTATGESCVAYSEFVRICSEASGGERGVEVARSLDELGAVIVWGNVVFLRPEEVAKAIETAMIPSVEDAERGEELRRMEETKAEIDRSAAVLVRKELWCGLGLMAAQTAAFMRLTFWELSWDVMEPICFYVTSIYFMAGYAFFLATSRELSFEGFFESRFAARQKRLMRARDFNVERFNELIGDCRRPHPSFAPVSMRKT
ncbi:hypothetical protein C4D60_Mb08t10620 [Musa balbisiana]|uniref:Calcium uniporter protein C-terminal domain-containing protein n=1 Tax=Musa balbisiana TaxID=52838 RepID=A0A4S8K2U5_MUSBA|nr:hypothetical protein C4D60_Mb08t10620 [Musa balbisiana]